MTVLSVRKLVALAGIALALAGCQAEPPPPAPPPAESPVALSERLLMQASTYEAYMEAAGGMSADFRDPTQIAQSLRVGAAYEPQQLLQGMIAYGAVAALQEPAFTANFRTYRYHPTQARALAAQLARNPHYVASFPGAAEAAGRIIAAVGSEGQRMLATGRAVRQSAYDVQRQPWSKGEVVDRPARLADAKMLSITPVAPTLAEVIHLQEAMSGQAALAASATPAPPPYSPTVIRSLALAAMAALGEAGEADMDLATAVTAEPIGAKCLSRAKMNLLQCLAVAKPHYEDVFCLGQHVLMDTGQCVVDGTGAAPLPTPSPLSLAATPAPTSLPPPTPAADLTRALTTSQTASR